MNLRFEARTGSLINSANTTYGENQILLNNSLSPVAYFGTAACGIVGTINANAINCTGFTMPTGAGIAKVLTSDPSGNATWMDPALPTNVGNLTMSGYLYNPAGRFLLANSTANSSLYLGEGGNSLVTGQSNVICGPSAYNMTTSSYTTAIGTSALTALSTAFFNTAAGYQALPTVTTGNSNTAAGSDAGRGITTGANNTFLGVSTNATVGSISGSTCLGSGAFVTTSNTVQLGGSNVTAVNTYGTVNAPALVGTNISGTAITTTNLNASSYRAPTVQGTYVTWNRSGSSGIATWGNQQGGGGGGMEWTHYNIGTSATTVNMTLDTASRLTVNGGVYLPSGGNASLLDCYEEYSLSSTFSGPVTVGPYTIPVTRVGNVVTLYMSTGVSATTVTSNTFTWNMTTVLPARFRPVTGVNTLVLGRNSNTLSILNAVVDNGGNLIINIALNPSFTWGGIIGFNAFSISWTV